MFKWQLYMQAKSIDTDIVQANQTESNPMSLPPMTREVAQLLGVPYERLFRLVNRGLIPPPPKSASGDYHWPPELIEQARAALKIDRRRKEHRQQQATPAPVSA